MMTYKQKADKFKDMIYLANKSGVIKWKNKEELDDYLKKYNGKIKTDRKRKKGYLVCLVQRGRKGFRGSKYWAQEDLVVEVPMDFAMNVLVFGFP